MATVTAHCPRCHSDEVYQYGRSCSRHECSVVAHVNVFSSPLTLMKPENPALRSRALKWHITAQVSAIPPEH